MLAVVEGDDEVEMQRCRGVFFFVFESLCWTPNSVLQKLMTLLQRTVGAPIAWSMAREAETEDDDDG